MRVYIMKDKMLTVLKYMIFATLYAIVIFIVFKFVCLAEFGNIGLSKTGDITDMILFFGLPVLSFSAPFAIKLIIRCNFRKMILFAFISVLVYVLLYFGTDLIQLDYCNSLTPEKLQNTISGWF